MRRGMCEAAKGPSRVKATYFTMPTESKVAGERDTQIFGVS
jgi:hypothetical protein